MVTINAEKYGIMPCEDITENLCKLIEDLANIEDEVTVNFEKGEYFVDSNKCKQYMLYITNTAGEKEFSKNEKQHLNAVPFYFSGLKNVVFDGGDSIFVIDGKVTNMAFENCENFTVKNIEIRHKQPDLHELKVVKKDKFAVEFELDSDTDYCVKGGKLCFMGNGYKSVAPKNAWWIGRIQEEAPNKIERVASPLLGATSIKDLGDRKIRVCYFNVKRFNINDCFYIYDVRRQYAGIFVNKCKNIVFEGIKQRFNYSLALVAQDSENVSLINSEFAPEQGSVRKMASIADFAQICSCRGDILIDGNYFDGAGDDCLNVHGVHFKITQKLNNQIKVRFMHPQTFGFNPLREGDKIAFIDTSTLLETAEAVIKKSELVSKYEILLTLDDVSGAKVGDVIEDTTACPNVKFLNNKLTRIITRGVLLTTRGKVLLQNNHFVSTTMSTVLLSDDAKSWYESGMCLDVTLQNNVVDYCGEVPIFIWPENAVHNGAVHKNIKILDNTIGGYTGYAISAKSTDNIEVKGNTFNSDLIIKQKNCQNVVLTNNTPKIEG